MFKRRSLLLGIYVLLSIQCYSQIKFEKGYYVDNSGQKVSCLIRNVEWKYNPKAIDIKSSENSEVRHLEIEDVREFQIVGAKKYIRYSVNIDRSSLIIRDMSEIRSPVFNEETLFLEELLDGKASLYYYENVNLVRFFYTLDNGEPSQLVYKKYRNSENFVVENNDYKQELFNSLKCESVSVEFISRMKYNRTDLIKLFSSYNSCQDSDYKVSGTGERRKGKFNLSIRPGVMSNSLSLERVNRISSPSEIDFGNNIGYRIGLEAEFVFPFNKNKWSVFIEPIYKSYSATGTTFDTFAEAEIDYNSIEIPLGLRYYMFANDTSKFFINAAVLIHMDFDSEIVFDDNRRDFLVDRGVGWAAGFGYNYNNKLSLEVRYNGNRNIIFSGEWYTEYSGVSLVIGYNFL